MHRRTPSAAHVLPSGRRRLVRGASAAAVSVALLLGGTACASEASSTNDSGQTVLKVYGWKGGETEPANIADVNSAFEKAHPEIDLEFEYVPANDAYTQRVQPELLAGNSADVIMTDSGKVQDWGSSGYLADLSDSDWTDSVLPDVTPFTQNEGTTYALPMEVIGIDLYANTDLLAQAGVETVPTTWPDFLDALQKVKDAGITPLSLPNKNGWTGASVLNAIAATDVYGENPDWDAQFLDGSASFTDWQSSVDKMAELQSKGFVDYKTELGVDEWSQGLPDFTSGKSAFWFQGAWNQTAVSDAGVNDVFIPFPAGESGTEPTANLFVGTMWSVNAKTQVAEAANEYLEFWADSENAAPYVEAENAVTPFTGGTTPSTPATEDFVAAFEDGRYRILPSNTWFSNEGEKTLQQQVQALQLDQITDSEMFSTLDDELR